MADNEGETPVIDRTEFVALAHYYATRSVMLAVMSLVGLNFALFVAGFMIGIGAETTAGGDVSPVILVSIAVGGLWFVALLAMSIAAFADHADFNRRVRLLRSEGVYGKEYRL